MTDQLSTNVYSVLTKLTDGRFHSGQSLGEYLQVSRTSVWNAVQTINQIGVAVDAVPGKGYRLRQKLELLVFDQIQKKLSDSAKKQIER